MYDQVQFVCRTPEECSAVEYGCGTACQSIDHPYAYVNNEKYPNTINICPQVFFTLPTSTEVERTGSLNDTEWKFQSSVLIHEVLHLERVGDVPDRINEACVYHGEFPCKAYGPRLSQWLAHLDPALANDNADNYVYYSLGITMGSLVGLPDAKNFPKNRFDPCRIVDVGSNEPASTAGSRLVPTGEPEVQNKAAAKGRRELPGRPEDRVFFSIVAGSAFAFFLLSMLFNRHGSIIMAVCTGIFLCGCVYGYFYVVW